MTTCSHIALVYRQHPTGDERRHWRVSAVGDVTGCLAGGLGQMGDVQPVVEKVGHHQRSDGAEDEARVETHGDELGLEHCAAEKRIGDHDQHHEIGDVDDPSERGVKDVGKEQAVGEARYHPRGEHLRSTHGNDQEAPEYEQVVLGARVPRARAALGHFLLEKEVDDDRPDPGPELVRSRQRVPISAACSPDHRVQGPPEKGEGGGQQDDENHLFHRRVASYHK
jgi:hypothetical protein